jgi:hypothetical protein
MESLLTGSASSSNDAEVVAHMVSDTRADRRSSIFSTKSEKSNRTINSSPPKPESPHSFHKPSNSECTITMSPPKQCKYQPETAAKDVAFIDLSYQATNPTKSFTIRSIDLLIKQNPTIEIELSLLKKTVREHEDDIEHAKTVLEVEMHKKLWESFVKIEKLEKRLEGKIAIVCISLFLGAHRTIFAILR